MFHGRQINEKINKLHERALIIVCNDTVKLFKDLLIKGKTFSICQQNIKSLEIEIYSAINNLSGGNWLKFSFFNPRKLFNLSGFFNYKLPNSCATSSFLNYFPKSIFQHFGNCKIRARVWIKKWERVAIRQEIRTQTFYIECHRPIFIFHFLVSKLL